MNLKYNDIALSKLSIHLLLPKIADKINREYTNTITVIPILDAAFMFASDLIKLIKVPVRLKFMKVKSYYGTNRCVPKVQLLCNNSDIINQDVLIVDTIIDSGNTIRYAINHLNSLTPRSIKVCALIIKNNEENRNMSIDFYGVSNLDGFLFGYGTDLNNGSYRNLTNIYSKRD